MADADIGLCDYFNALIHAPRMDIVPLAYVAPDRFARFCNADRMALWVYLHGAVPDWLDPAVGVGADYVAGYYIPYLMDMDRQDGSALFLAQSKATAEFIGAATLFVDAAGRNRLGYFILPSCRGSGFGRECHAAVLSYTDGVLIDPVTVAEVAADNPASARVLERNGFSYHRDVYPTAGNDRRTLHREYRRPVPERGVFLK